MSKRHFARTPDSRTVCGLKWRHSGLYATGFPIAVIDDVEGCAKCQAWLLKRDPSDIVKQQHAKRCAFKGKWICKKSCEIRLSYLDKGIDLSKG